MQVTVMEMAMWRWGSWPQQASSRAPSASQPTQAEVWGQVPSVAGAMHSARTQRRRWVAGGSKSNMGCNCCTSGAASAGDVATVMQVFLINRSITVRKVMQIKVLSRQVEQPCTMLPVKSQRSCAGHAFYFQAGPQSSWANVRVDSSGNLHMR